MKSNKVFIVMAQEIYATLRRVYFLIFAFILPVVLGVVAGVIYFLNRDAVPELPEEVPGLELPIQGYVDEAGLIHTIPPELPPGTFTPFDDEGQAMAALKAGEIDGYFVVHPDYLASGALEYITLEFNPLEDGMFNTRLFEQILTLNLFGDDLELATQVLEPLQVEVVRLEGGEEAGAETNWMAEQLPFFLVLLLYMVILIPASSLVNSITDEKKNRVLEILLSSVSPAQFFIGKLLALGLLGILQTLVWVAMLWGVARFGGQPLNLPESFIIPTHLLVWAVLYSLMGYAMYGTQMAGIGALAPNMNDSRSLTFLVLAPLILGYTFNIIFLEAPHSLLAVIFGLFPLTGPVVMVGRMAAADLPLWQPVLALVLQAVTVVWIVRLFTRLFRAQALLSGQALTFRRLVRALRTP